MAGPVRKQRKPTVPHLKGLDFKSVSELKSDSEKTLRSNKIHNYAPKKRVILLPGPAPDANSKKEAEEKE